MVISEVFLTSHGEFKNMLHGNYIAITVSVDIFSFSWYVNNSYLELSPREK